MHPVVPTHLFDRSQSCDDGQHNLSLHLLVCLCITVSTIYLCASGIRDSLFGAIFRRWSLVCLCSFLCFKPDLGLLRAETYLRFWRAQRADHSNRVPLSCSNWKLKPSGGGVTHSMIHAPENNRSTSAVVHTHPRPRCRCWRTWTVCWDRSRRGTSSRTMR